MLWNGSWGMTLPAQNHLVSSPSCSCLVWKTLTSLPSFLPCCPSTCFPKWLWICSLFHHFTWQTPTQPSSLNLSAIISKKPPMISSPASCRTRSIRRSHQALVALITKDLSIVVTILFHLQLCTSHSLGFASCPKSKFCFSKSIWYLAGTK